MAHNINVSVDYELQAGVSGCDRKRRKATFDAEKKVELELCTRREKFNE